MPLGGITGGTQAILAYNYGAGNTERIKKAEKYIAAYALVFTGILFLAAQIIPEYFVKIFTQNETYISLTVWAIRVYTLGIIPLALQYTIVDGFTGMGIVPYSFFILFSYYHIINILQNKMVILTIFRKIIDKENKKNHF